MLSGIVPGNIFYAFADGMEGDNEISGQLHEPSQPREETMPEPAAVPTDESTLIPTFEPTVAQALESATAFTPEQRVVPYSCKDMQASLRKKPPLTIFFI